MSVSSYTCRLLKVSSCQRMDLRYNVSIFMNTLVDFWKHHHAKEWVSLSDTQNWSEALVGHVWKRPGQWPWLCPYLGGAGSLGREHVYGIRRGRGSVDERVVLLQLSPPGLLPPPPPPPPAVVVVTRHSVGWCGGIDPLSICPSVSAWATLHCCQQWFLLGAVPSQTSRHHHQPACP